MSKWPSGSIYIANFINHLFYLPDTFPRGLEVDLEGSSTFLSLTLLMHIDRLGLVSHLHDVCLIVLPHARVARLALQPFVWKLGGAAS